MCLPFQVRTAGVYVPGTLRRLQPHLAAAQVDGGRYGDPNYEQRLVRVMHQDVVRTGRITAYNLAAGPNQSILLY